MSSVNVTIVMQDKFGVKPLKSPQNDGEMMAALYLQVSIISQALIFVTRSRSWSFLERPGFLLLSAFIAAQLVRTHLTYYIQHLSLVLYCQACARLNTNLLFGN